MTILRDVVVAGCAAWLFGVLAYWRGYRRGRREERALWERNFFPPPLDETVAARTGREIEIMNSFGVRPKTPRPAVRPLPQR